MLLIKNKMMLFFKVVSSWPAGWMTVGGALHILEPVLASVPLKARGWMKIFFVVVLMIGYSLRVYSNCFAAPGEEPLPTSGSFSFDTLDDCLVLGFLGGIVSTTK
jgi:hypothetical protein